MIDDRTPNGFWKIDAYTNGYQIVVLGDPPHDEDINNPPFHSCDQMGCGILDHVVAIVPVMKATPELRWSGDGIKAKLVDFPVSDTNKPANDSND